ncbi:LysR family transcriptional regulator [Allostella vacuolata]|nr:LysR family transcriptional regulator [Stella vacuolata]
MRFDIIDLRLFIAVADSGSLTAGAVRMGLALPSASQRIRGMELALDGRLLLQRARGGARPTEDGRLLLGHARAIVAAWQRMQAELGFERDSAAGRVRLWVNTAAMADIVPGRLPAFLQAHPTIAVDIEEQPSDCIVAAVADGAADLGLAIDLGFAVPVAVDAVPLRPDPLVLLVPAASPLARRRRPHLADLAGEGFVALAADNPLQAYIARHAAAAGTALRVRARVADFDALCRMVADGAGLAILPAAAARRHRGRQALRILGLADAWAERRLLLYRPCSRRLAPRVQLLADHLLGNLPQAGAATRRITAA